MESIFQENIKQKKVGYLYQTKQTLRQKKTYSGKERVIA